MNVIVTGYPGVGKTTVIEKLAAALGSRAGGFLTREVRQGGRRTGFLIESLDGHRSLLARRDRKGGPRVGSYRVLVANLEAVGVQSIRHALDTKEIVIVDEIGKMELMSPGFRDIIMLALDSDKTVVATLSMSKDPFSERIRNRSDITMLEVRHDNRDLMASRIREVIEAQPQGGWL
jgi:nucleoside-triphosphatase